ncbi:hypothetical protein Rsub_09501 [Raphidocelis subcapitata]|uniref:Uncharacterized protein n=1 Tax=Raphidocelis subcapitata TaxID=307507 RepID=A0A2V0PAZ3_9CHLO|nr:hypothetical protein Rsub_09501 [Raphidocelis subcapitata]|eukprot:GBF97028.1 hypothetical protein Rsub_09501 [Raphidocelis subcapitata]
MGQACSSAKQKDKTQADQPGHGAPDQAGAGAVAPAAGACAAATAAAGDSDKRKPSAGGKAVSIAPKAAFLDPSGQEGEMSIKSGISFTAPGGAQLPVVRASPSPPLPHAHADHGPSPLLAPHHHEPSSAAHHGLQALAAAHAAAAAEPGRSREHTRSEDGDGGNSTAAYSRGGTTMGGSVKSQVSSASERSELTGAAEAVNSDVEEQAVPSAKGSGASSPSSSSSSSRGSEDGGGGGEEVGGGGGGGGD